mgnify:FL=1
MANNGIVSVVKLRKTEVLEMIAAGQSLANIATHLGLSTPTAILQRLEDDPDYQIAMQRSAWSKLQRRETELEIADSNVHVTRADRLLGHARWFAERVARRWFAPETRITGADGGPIVIQVMRFSGQTIDGAAQHIAEAAQHIPEPVKSIVAELPQVIDDASK